jgi:hypothetical protein
VTLTTGELHDLAVEVDAECRSNPLLFFSNSRQEREVAEIVCGRCRIAWECLDYARKNGITWGVWGGVDFALVEQKRKGSSRTRIERTPQTPARQGKVNHDG